MCLQIEDLFCLLSPFSSQYIFQTSEIKTNKKVFFFLEKKEWEEEIVYKFMGLFLAPEREGERNRGSTQMVMCFVVRRKSIKHMRMWKLMMCDGDYVLLWVCDLVSVYIYLTGQRVTILLTEVSFFFEVLIAFDSYWIY